jgi:signal transduction histidine kinase
MLSPYRTVFGNNTDIHNELENLAIFLTSAFYFQFLSPYLPSRVNPLIRGYQILQILLAVITLITPSLDPRVMVAWNIVTVLLGTAFFILIARQALFGHNESRYIAAGMLGMAATYIIDFSVGRKWVSSVVVFPYGLAMQIYVFTLTLASRVPRFYAEFDSLRDGLERRAKEKTQELAERTRDLIAINAKLTTMTKELSAANQKLSVRTNELAEASLAKSQFLASMSHELRTPLNAIIGYSEMLKEELEHIDSDLIPDVEKVNAAGKHLLGMISEILDLSKLEAGKMEISIDTFHLSDVLKEVVTAVTPLMEKNGNAFEFKNSEDLGTMRADPEKVKQILLHVLTNAAKFTQEGLVTLDVRKERINGMEKFCFKIHDSGIGMTSEQMRKIFTAFTQADGSMTRKYGGTGLGLAISQQYCQMMGGTISATSEFSVGSTFEIILPAYVPDSD